MSLSKGTRVPTDIHIEYLKSVSREDAEQYALGFIKNKAVSSVTYYGVFSLHDDSGYLVEIQEGGEGRALFPSLQSLPLQEGESSGVLRSSKKSLFVRLSDKGVSSLVLPSGYSGLKAPLIEPSDQKLTRISFGHSVLIRNMSIALFASSLAAFIVAGVFQPNGSQVIIQSAPVESLPSHHWNKSPYSKTAQDVKTIRFENKKWTVYPSPVPEQSAQEAQATHVPEHAGLKEGELQ